MSAMTTQPARQRLLRLKWIHTSWRRVTAVLLGPGGRGIVGIGSGVAMSASSQRDVVLAGAARRDFPRTPGTV